MKKVIGMGVALAATLLASPLVMAEIVGATSIVKTQILKVEAPESPLGMYSVLSTADGRVYAASAKNNRLLKQLQALAGTRRPVSLEIIDDTVVAMNLVTGSEAVLYSDSMSDLGTRQLMASVSPDSLATSFAAPSDSPGLNGYQPTILNSMSEAHDLYASERQLKHSSQCHQRAMVWAYEMYTSRQIRSMKVIMFYTDLLRHTYTRSGFFGTKPYKWWYHTAPFVYVGNQEIVLDSEFLPSELTMDNWTNHFIGDETLNFTDNKYAPHLNPDQTRCHVMQSYDEYNHQTGNDWCMVRKIPMYYMQPNSVEALDLQGKVLTDFDPSFIKDAYSGASGR